MQLRLWNGSSKIFMVFMVVLLSAITLSTSFVGDLFAQETTYIVQIGEDLNSIAAQFDVSVEALAEANGLPVDATLFVGQQLVIPTTSTSDEADATPTPRTSTAGNVTTDVEVIDTRPTAIPAPIIPTPLPYDPNRLISIIDPPEGERFTINLNEVPVRGVVQFDPQTMDYWKIEIRGQRRRSRIWQNNDPFQSVPAYDWVTLDTIRRDAVIDGRLGVIPAFPTIDAGNWDVRVVIVGKDGQFVDEVIIPFRVRPEFDAVNASIASPFQGQILQPGDPITGTLNFNFAVGNYRIDVLGGDFYTWYTAVHVINDPGNPIDITQGVIGNLPTHMVPGRYRARLVVNNRDGNWIQDPFEVEFAIETNAISNLPVIDFTFPRDLARRGRIRTTDTVPIRGTVHIPDPDGYFKIDIKDAEALEPGQEPRFQDWTTVGQIQTDDVTNGRLGEAPGISAIPPGSYQMRLAIVTSYGEFSDVEIFRLEVQE